MAKAWEVLAVSVDGEFVCEDCTQTKDERAAFRKTVEGISPLFVSDSDGTETCGRCHKNLSEAC
jgi:hypothetical protein